MTDTTASAPTQPPPGPVAVDGHGLGALSELENSAWVALSGMTRALHVKNGDLPATLDAILRLARLIVPDAEHVGLNLLVRGKFVPQAVLGAAPPQLDALQQRLGAGPCVDCSRGQKEIRIEVMADEQRWTQFAELAERLGVHSMLCVPLWVDDQALGSLSLYGTRVSAFTAYHEHVAALLATHGAVAISAARMTDNLRQALVNRDTIGQAKGILMERLRITADEAFALLISASQKSNVKLSSVAERLTETGSLPD